MQANTVEWQIQRRDCQRHLSVRRRRPALAVDRPEHLHAGARVHGRGDRHDLPYPFFGGDRPFANFLRVISFESTAVSRFNGLTLELNRRFAGDKQLRVAYTLGKVVDTVPDATAVVPGNSSDDVKYASNPANFDADRTVGNNDQRHRFVASGLYSTNGLASGLDGFMAGLVRGWSFSAILTAQSGQPYTARVGVVDLNNDGNASNDLAPGTTRNQFRLPSVVTFDPRIARDLPLGRTKVQLIWEVNLFNRDNIIGVPIRHGGHDFDAQHDVRASHRERR
jgi:hypothetical protein